MTRRPDLTRRQALDAVPVPAPVLRRERIGDDGCRITVELHTPRWQRMILRAADTLHRTFELDAYGREVLDLCDGQRTVRRIVDRFAEAHDLDRHQASLAVMTFLKTLIARRILAVAIPPETDAQPQ